VFIDWTEIAEFRGVGPQIFPAPQAVMEEENFGGQVVDLAVTSLKFWFQPFH
jgi:hypothetical protein